MKYAGEHVCSGSFNSFSSYQLVTAVINLNDTEDLSTLSFFFFFSASFRTQNTISPTLALQPRQLCHEQELPINYKTWDPQQNFLSTEQSG